MGKVKKETANLQTPRTLVTVKQAAEMMNVSERLVYMIAWVEQNAPDLIPAVEQGNLSVHAATQIAKARMHSGLVLREDQAERQQATLQGHTVVASMRKGQDEALIAWAEKEGRFVRIDRKTAWGNPFELTDDGDRDTVVQHYVWYLQRKPSLLKQLQSLQGKVLGCWCYPDLCHGDILAIAANWTQADNEEEGHE